MWCLHHADRIRKAAPEAIHHREGCSRFETDCALGNTLPVNTAKRVAGK